jgi:glucokinase
MSCAIGIDLGGTNIKGLAVTVKGKVLARALARTNDGTEVWQRQVLQVVHKLEKTLGGRADWLGLAAPGLASTDQRCIRYMPGRLPGLEGLNWAEYLGRPHPVPVLNDAHAALMGEAWLGAARGSRNAILLTLGTGVGGAALVDGQLLRGHIGRAGHLGHISLDPHGARDITGTPGSLEDAIGECTLAQRSGGRFTSTAELVRAVRRRDRSAQGIWSESVRALAAAIAGFINVLDPQVVVIGGGIAQAGPTLFRPLSTQLAQFEWRPGGHKARIVPARLGDKAGAFGAAWNAMHFQSK